MARSEFALFYDEALERATPYSARNDYVGKARDRIERTFGLIKKEARRGVVADIGASPFYLLYLCQTVGASEAHGIYFSHDTHPLKDQKFIHSAYGPIQLSHCNVEREKLDLPDASVDVLTACEIFEHFDEFPAHFCGEILRVLRSGGTLAITVPNVCSLGNIAKLVLQRNIYMKYRSDTTGRHKHEFTMSQLRDLVRYLGLDEVDHGYFPSPTSDKFYLRPFYRALASLPVLRRYSPNLYIKARKPYDSLDVDLETYPASMFDRSSSIEE